MSTTEDLSSYYTPWHNHKQTYKEISPKVFYVGHFNGFGPIQPRAKIFLNMKVGVPANALQGQHEYQDRTFAEKALDATLEGLKDCVLLCTTASYYSQFQGACLLKSRGFQLLGDSCYRHPGYPGVSQWKIEHPGIPDKYRHWEHIWYKVQGTPPKEIGLPKDAKVYPHFCLNNCGVDGLVGLEQIEKHSSGQSLETCNTYGPAPRRGYLAVGWLARGVPFPKGWKRFHSAEDYKLGHNLEHEGLKVVQKCPHNFDLKIFEDFEKNVDFNNWLPS